MRFEVVPTEYRKYASTDIVLPARGTRRSAGYDFYLNDDMIIQPGETKGQFTDVRVHLDDDKLLWLTPRSSTGELKLMIPQTAGIIDADYVDNPKTGGNIKILLYNYGTETQHLKAGQRVVQGLIIPCFVTEDDNAEGERQGGFGSTGL